jgi:hypothetical protein
MSKTNNSVSQPASATSVLDPVIEFYKAGIDRTPLIENLRLTPQQRVDQMIELLEAIEKFQEAGEEAR